jgi:Fe-Mn family superoxide dismutase
VQVVKEIVRANGISARPLEQLVLEARERHESKLFNNAAQAWNHAFFWECMSPRGGSPSGALLTAIDTDLGGVEGLRQRFVSEGVAHFGSGWAWVVHKDGKLAVMTTHDADLPQASAGSVPLLVCDLWEHAYYLDYKNDRERFLRTWFDGLLSWSFVEQQYDAVSHERPGYRYPAPAG